MTTKKEKIIIAIGAILGILTLIPILIVTFALFWFINAGNDVISAAEKRGKELELILQDFKYDSSITLDYGGDPILEDLDMDGVQAHAKINNLQGATYEQVNSYITNYMTQKSINKKPNSEVFPISYNSSRELRGYSFILDNGQTMTITYSMVKDNDNDINNNRVSVVRITI